MYMKMLESQVPEMKDFFLYNGTMQSTGLQV